MALLFSSCLDKTRLDEFITLVYLHFLNKKCDSSQHNISTTVFCLSLVLHICREFVKLCIDVTRLLNKHHQSSVDFRRLENSSPVLTDIFWAIILPPITASPVHIQCPSVPPTATPNGSWVLTKVQMKLMLKKIIVFHWYCIHYVLAQHWWTFAACGLDQKEKLLKYSSTQ